MANERNACLRGANDALARKLDRVGVKREKALVAMDVFLCVFRRKEEMEKGGSGRRREPVRGER